MYIWKREELGSWAVVRPYIRAVLVIVVVVVVSRPWCVSSPLDILDLGSWIWDLGSWILILAGLHHGSRELKLELELKVVRDQWPLAAGENGRGWKLEAECLSCGSVNQSICFLGVSAWCKCGRYYDRYRAQARSANRGDTDEELLQ